MPSRGPRISGYDLYRRIPTDLTAGTTQGGFLSLGCVLVMVLLFVMEVWTYFSPVIVTELALDENKDPQIRVNFNITALEMPCDWVSVDVKDQLGVNRIDVVQNVLKQHHTRDQELFEHEERPLATVQRRVTTPLGEMEAAMEKEAESPHLDKDKMEEVMKKNKFVFVDFYAPWCIWCKRLAPVWERFAEKIHAEHYHIAVRKMDCVEHGDLCQRERIRAFPTLRLYKNGKQLADFDGVRDEDGLTAWAAAITGEDELDHHLRHEDIKGMNENHLGCRVSGSLYVNRVPGNFHLNVKADAHSINGKDTNLTHVVHHLSFGEVLSPRVRNALPKKYRTLMQPLNNKLYINKEPHTTFEHHIKVMTTTYDLGGPVTKGYQIQHSDHQYSFEEQHAADDKPQPVPEARFAYDFTPTAIIVTYGGRRWYEFITNLCAIVGGVFTVMGLVDRSLHGMRSKIFKEAAGKLG